MKVAFNKKKKNVTIQLTKKQKGTEKQKISLTETQINKFNKSKTEHHGSRLELKCVHVKLGGFLPLIVIHRKKKNLTGRSFRKNIATS